MSELTDTFDRHLSDEINAGDAFHVHAKEFDRVRRYVTSIERAMYRAIKELDLLQAARFAAEREEIEMEMVAASRDDSEFVSQKSEAPQNTVSNPVHATDPPTARAA